MFRLSTRGQFSSKKTVVQHIFSTTDKENEISIHRKSHHLKHNIQFKVLKNKRKTCVLSISNSLLETPPKHMGEIKALNLYHL